jgi:hypothetical protein
MDLVASRSCANSDHHDNAPRFAQSARPREAGGVFQAPTGRPGRESLPPPSASARRHLPAAYGSRPGSAPRSPRLPLSLTKWRILAQYGQCRKPTIGRHPRTGESEKMPCLRSLPYFVTPAMEFSLRCAPPFPPSAFPLARSNQAPRSATSSVARRACSVQRAECALITGQGSPNGVRTGA